MLHKLEDPEFKERASARSKEMAAQWTIERQSGALMDIYERLAAERRS